MNWICRIALVVLLALTVMGIRGVPRAHMHVERFADPTVLVNIGDKGHGSGVYIGDGLVLTAAHVVGHGGDPLTVKTPLGAESPAKVLWVNEEHDVALLEISSLHVRPARLACRKPVEGEEVRLAGSPLDAGQLSTFGRVAGATRIWNKKEVTPISGVVLWGMSGGPVYDAYGEVIGINDMVTLGPVFTAMGPIGVSAEGIAWMVPSSVVCHLMGRGAEV